jgi:hypothetical protein
MIWEGRRESGGPTLSSTYVWRVLQVQEFLPSLISHGTSIFPLSPKCMTDEWDCRDLRKAAPGGTDKFPENMIVHSALQCRICLRSYKLFFVPSTEDYVYRKDAKVRDGAVERKLRAGRFDKWLEGRLGEKKVEGEDVKMEGV